MPARPLPGGQSISPVADGQGDPPGRHRHLAILGQHAGIGIFHCHGLLWPKRLHSVSYASFAAKTVAMGGLPMGLGLCHILAGNGL
ncbi:hypothetical protein X738_07810 [Mesorhizobium sp. LNHC209A00]|nr:hypothetical protein X738_07810 [Mesorhizobium sp. LNHC209A00]